MTKMRKSLSNPRPLQLVHWQSDALTAEKKLKLKKFRAEKKYIFLYKKNNNSPFPRPPKMTSKLQKKPSVLKTEHPALQSMKFLHFFYFCGPFLPSWIRIHFPNPDPLTRLNPDPIRIRIRNPEVPSPKYYRCGVNLMLFLEESLVVREETVPLLLGLLHVVILRLLAPLQQLQLLLQTKYFFKGLVVRSHSLLVFFII
jgi:hypothetical protein